MCVKSASFRILSNHDWNPDVMSLTIKKISYKLINHSTRFDLLEAVSITYCLERDAIISCTLSNELMHFIISGGSVELLHRGRICRYCARPECLSSSEGARIQV